jgi:hypothetical protein
MLGPWSYNMPAEVISLPIESVLPGPPLRDGGLDRDHVTVLRELNGDWPPIVVTRADRVVVDGHHRVAAARLLGLRTITGVVFEGTEEEAYLEAVRLNVSHGLPLTIVERKSAASRILGRNPEWSDRRIAKVCGVSPHTIRSLRTTVLPAGDEDLTGRVGTDDRIRVVRPKARRQQIVDAVRSHPDQSLRMIARAVGSSPETVRRIRRREAGPGPEQESGCGAREDTAGPEGAQESHAHPTTTEGVAVGPADRVAGRWRTDVALRSTPTGLEFASWFEGTNVDTCLRSYVGAVPLSRVYEVADEARRRGVAWIEFSRAVEERARRD